MSYYTQSTPDILWLFAEAKETIGAITNAH